MPTDLQQSWEQFVEVYSTLRNPPRTLLRGSDVLAEACVLLATSYSSNVVENFEQRVCSFIQHKLSAWFPTLKKWEAKDIASKYAFERIGGGTPEWPDCVEPTLPLVALTDSLCDDLEARVPKPATQEAISASPGSYVPVLKYILSCYEEEHRVAATTEQQSPDTHLPRLFSISPTPNTKWR
ncbi:hypothetical protein DFQ29_009088, partial [Apophysomyces sp. BC1021]